MGEIVRSSNGGLADTLIEIWRTQAREGFLLSDPNLIDIPTREVFDEPTGVTFRFRWMPHREIRGNIKALEQKGILNPNRDEMILFRDARDSHGRHCFLCESNIAECHPKEILVGMRLLGREFIGGANFAWIEPNHFTVMPREHCDQIYSRFVLDAMIDLHNQTRGRFRVLFNSPGAGATIPWHMHFQIVTSTLPIENLIPNEENNYPAAVRRFTLQGDGVDRAHALVQRWLDVDTVNRSVNLLVATVGTSPCIFVFPRDRRYASTKEKGLVGGFEVAGDFVLSSPSEEAVYKHANVAMVKRILGEVRPPSWADTEVWHKNLEQYKDGMPNEVVNAGP